MIRVEVSIDPGRIQVIHASACDGWCMLLIDRAGPRLQEANPDAPLYHWVHARLEDVAPLLWRET